MLLIRIIRCGFPGNIQIELDLDNQAVFVDMSSEFHRTVSPGSSWMTTRNWFSTYIRG